MPGTLRFDLFGRELVVAATAGGWAAFYVGQDGKRRPATEVVLPPGLPESEIGDYLADLCHEWASDRHPRVVRLDGGA